MTHLPARSNLAEFKPSRIIFPAHRLNMSYRSWELVPAHFVARTFPFEKRTMDALSRMTLSEQGPAAEILLAFRESWERGERPCIADYLDDPTNIHLICELSRIDLLNRLLSGESARVEDYLKAFPTLTKDATLVLALISVEYKHRAGEGVEFVEYERRFPNYARLLHTLPGHEEAPSTKRSSEHGRSKLPEGFSETFIPISSDESSESLPAPVEAGKRELPNIEGYQILEILGRGGMGVVYKALQVKLKRLVALKMVLAGAHAGPKELARFKAEAEAVARLQHPNIVQIYEVGGQDDCPFFSLEYVDGGPLDKRENRGEPMDVRQAAELVETLARALHFAHERGVVHRDIKPANILMTSDGVPKITDFGLAKQLDASQHDNTRTGAVMGTPSYMAPEQARGQSKAIGRATDIYALGAILYELLTGRPPFVGETAMDTILMLTNEDPVPPSRLCSLVPRDLETICLKCLEKSPRNRYATASEFADELRRFVTHAPILARPVGRIDRVVRWIKRHPTMSTALASAAMIAFGSLSVLAVRHQQERGRLDVIRQKVSETRARADQAANNMAWESAGNLYESAINDVEHESGLSDLRAELEQQRGAVQKRVECLNTVKKFARLRDDATFHATLAGGEGQAANLESTRQFAREAMELVGLRVPIGTDWKPDPAYTEEEQTELRQGCYELVMTLADAAAQSQPSEKDEVRKEHVREGLTILDDVLHVGPPIRAYHLRRGRYLTLLGDEAAARGEQDQAARCPCEKALDHFLVGDELYKRGDTKQAQAEFKEALRLEGDNFWANYFLGLCYIKLGETDRAIEPLNHCLQQKKGLIWIRLMRGYAFGQISAYDAAAEDFEQVDKALQQAPNKGVQYVLYNNRAVVHISKKNYDAAVDDLRRAIEIEPNKPEAYATIAQVFFVQKKWDDAVRELDRAIETANKVAPGQQRDPATLGVLYRTRSRANLGRQDTGAALADLEQVLPLVPKTDPLWPELQGERGRLLQKQRRFDDAVKAYTLAVESPHADPEIYRWQAEVFLQQQRFGEAIQAFDALVKREGRLSVKDYQARALANQKKGNLPGAIEDLTRAREGAPEDASLLGYRGTLYLATQAYTLAMSDFDEAIRLRPSDGSFFNGRGYARAKLGQHQNATADADRALLLGPRSPRLVYRACRTFSQAAGQVENDRNLNKLAIAKAAQTYQEKAVRLLRESLGLLPAEQQRQFWRDTVAKDLDLNPIRRLPEFRSIEQQFGGRPATRTGSNTEATR
jgi:serine/threonine protein kinase/tetratricopeptide (TPR) repeat protein